MARHDGLEDASLKASLGGTGLGYGPKKGWSSLGGSIESVRCIGISAGPISLSAFWDAKDTAPEVAGVLKLLES